MLLEQGINTYIIDSPHRIIFFLIGHIKSGKLYVHKLRDKTRGNVKFIAPICKE